MNCKVYYHLKYIMTDEGVITLHYAINQLSATTHTQLYVDSQTPCATVEEQWMFYIIYVHPL